MKTSDMLFVTSDRREGWGAVVNEAFNVGTPVVASSSIGAANYIIIDGFNGYLYDKFDAQIIKYKIIDIKNNIEYFKINAIETSRVWSYYTAAERLIQIINNMLNETTYSSKYNSGPLSQA